MPTARGREAGTPTAAAPGADRRGRRSGPGPARRTPAPTVPGTAAPEVVGAAKGPSRASLNGRRSRTAPKTPPRYARARPEAPPGEERLLRELLRVEVSRSRDRGANEWFFRSSKATPEAERIYRPASLRLASRATPVPPPRRLREVA